MATLDERITALAQAVGADIKALGEAQGANAYTHPASHPASIITQDANHRFVTDAEKAAWNAKQDALEGNGNTVSPTGELAKRVRRLELNSLLNLNL